MSPGAREGAIHPRHRQVSAGIRGGAARRRGRHAFHVEVSRVRAVAPAQAGTAVTSILTSVAAATVR